MRTSRLLLFVTFLAEVLIALAPAQESAFQLPVQLIGFPVIIVAVRLSNFVKKLAYSLNPRTYTSRSRRGVDAHIDPAMDVLEVEKKLTREFGTHVCIYERVCTHYAELTHNQHGSNHILDWDTIFGKYKSSPAANKQNYLLSVFLGNIVASPSLCHALAKRGHGCTGDVGDLLITHVRHNATALPHGHSRQRTSPSLAASSAHHRSGHSTRRGPSSHAGSHERLAMDHPAQVPRRH